jgi:effector-binding domain-containing protein
MPDTAAEPAPEVVEVEPRTTAVVRGVVPVTDLAGFFDRSFGILAEVLEAQGASIQSPAFGLYRGPVADTVDIEVGFVTAAAVEPTRDVVPSGLPGGQVARVVHEGSFDTLASSWSRLGEWMADEGLAPGPLMWEVYVTRPSPDMDPADLRTELYWPVAGPT